MAVEPGSRVDGAARRRLPSTTDHADMRERIMEAWASEQSVVTAEDLEALWLKMMPFQYKDPFDPRMAELMERGAGVVYSSKMVRAFAEFPIEVEIPLASVTQPVLVIAGGYDRTCSMPAAEATVAGIPDAEVLVLENSGHMTFVEEKDRYI
jgi:pimeloyl-ACP methyl ester carboxylesterase